MNNFRSVLIKFLRYVLPLVFVLLMFIVYLAVGGTWQRENIKSWIVYLKPSGADFVINSNGGDCAKIGNWSASSKTCTLTGDLSDAVSILVTGDGVTIEGNGHSMLGRDDVVAIRVYRAKEYRIRNLLIDGYLDGMHINYSVGGKIENVFIANIKGYGIDLENASNFNRITGNVIKDCGYHGISLLASNGNHVTNNSVTRTRDAIRLQDAHNNVILGNETRDNRVEGLDFHESWGNLVVFNRMFEDEATPIISFPHELTDNSFYLPMGGNYYSLLDSDAKRCIDVDSDSVCDSAHSFEGGVDERPLTEELADRTEP